jgi:para-aminobenzoate synthetase/4-amino-4-deoxychorismate lyase
MELVLIYHKMPSAVCKWLNKRQNSVLLETTGCDSVNFKSRCFWEPVRILTLHRLEALPEFFTQIEHYLGQGFYLAGYFSYECGYYFEAGAPVVPGEAPLAWLGVYREPLVFDHLTGEFASSPDPQMTRDEAVARGNYRLRPEGFNLTLAEYCRQIEMIREYIAAGDVYQINFTGRYRFAFSGDAHSLYQELKAKQPVAYSSFINDGYRQILSFSPELFFKTQAAQILAKPMKGTAPRGHTTAEDQKWAAWLKQDEKNRAENLMIVDLLRNDLGRIAAVGSVRVPELFAVERYQTLHQMTSTVTGILKPGISYYELFRSLFPCGSVTGAPKVRAMQLIHQLEKVPRGVYTGAIGYFGPDRTSMFNVAIRTVVIEQEKATMGIGGGVVFDSEPADEYRECQLKASFVIEPAEDFRLLEAVLWDNGYVRLSRHLQRLSDSAHYFDYSFDHRQLERQLQQNSHQLTVGLKYKVRLELDRSGELTITNQVLTVREEPRASLVIASVQTNSANRFLYHKTTNRQLYQDEYQKAVARGCTEVIFLNEKNEVTEGAISNIIIAKDGRWYTPPQECGLLNGVYRGYLLETASCLGEKVLHFHDLQNADRLYICNAIRGLRQAELMTSDKRKRGGLNENPAYFRLASWQVLGKSGTSIGTGRGFGGNLPSCGNPPD